MNCSDLTISANHDQAVHSTGLNVNLKHVLHDEATRLAHGAMHRQIKD